MRILLLASLMILTGCQVPKFSIFSDKKITKCPEKPTEVLTTENVKEINLTEEEKTKSGFIQKGVSRGYKFEAKKDKKLNYSTEDDVCVWIYTPDLSILQEPNIPEDGIYFIQLSTLKGSQSYEIKFSLKNADTVSSEKKQPAENITSEANYVDMGLSAEETIKKYFQHLILKH